MENADKKALVDGITKILFDDEVTAEILSQIVVIIPPHSNSLGVDTTRLYKLLDGAKQYGHSTKIASIKPQGYSGGDYTRSLRQQDVAVTVIGELTDKRWRADVDKNHTTMLTIPQKPWKWMKKNLPLYIDDLKTILQYVTSEGTELKFL